MAAVRHSKSPNSMWVTAWDPTHLGDGAHAVQQRPVSAAREPAEAVACGATRCVVMMP